MADWQPDLYLRFERDRTRPSEDLLARIPGGAERVLDLGCGPGNSTALLSERFPGAQITGLDTSPAMLEQATARLPDARFIHADIADFQPDEPLDVIFANAVLHWLPDHPTLLPRLMRMLSPGGRLAIQMPINLDEPAWTAMAEVATSGPWAAKLAQSAGARTRPLAQGALHDILAPLSSDLDQWDTTYAHVMPNHAAIMDWLRGAGLKPWLEPLNGTEADAFLAAYRPRIEAAYPVRADGQILFPFPRRFLVACRGS
ncbi:MAG: trans-aconitate 2-methyltransferase [Pseudomonadota bacterium]